MLRALRALTLGLLAAAALGPMLAGGASGVPGWAQRAGALRGDPGSARLPAGLRAAIRRSRLEPMPTALVRTGAGAVTRLAGGATVRVTPDGGLSAGFTGESFGLRPVGIGRSRLTPARPGAVQVTAAGTSEDFAAMSVWYRSERWGLEQGFTVAHRPRGRGPLRIVMRTGGSLVATLTGPSSLSLRPRHDRTRTAAAGGFTYSGLTVTDARGHRVSAHLRLAGSRLQIVVSDPGVHYPLTVDPTLAQQQELTGSDIQTGDVFGSAVALSSDGSTAVVGAPFQDSSMGAAYVFTRSGTTWTQQQELTAADGATGSDFGASVTVSSDGATALIGAPTAGSAGAAYVFTRSGTTWTQQQELTAAGGQNGDRLGAAVALSGDGSTALVGADGAAAGTGAAYAFTRSGTTWTPQQELTAADGSAGNSFGTAVALAGDGSTALIGARGATSGAGAAYTFTRSGGAWTTQQELTAADGSADNSFGAAVALSGDGSTALVGADGAASSTGTAYVFTQSASTWTQGQELTASAGSAGDAFGTVVALSGAGSTALVGAGGAAAGAGSAYVFTRSGSTWTSRHQLTAADARPGNGFGLSVALSPDGGTALAGSPGNNAAYAFVAPAATATALFSSGNALAVGDQVTYTATIAPIPDSGTVAFTDDGGAITGCDAVAVDANGHAACQTTFAVVGSASIVASYSGDGDFGGSSSAALTQTVSQAATATVIASSGNPSAAGDQVTYTASVAPIPDGGTVAFTEGGATITGCDAAPVGGLGNATCQTIYPAAGSHPITATYSGDGNFLGSASAPLTQTVGAATSATTLTSSANPSAFGRPVIFTATVSPAPGGGSVAFTDSGSTLPGCGAVALGGNGRATCQTTPAAVGSHAITATYSGDGDFTDSASVALTQAVAQAGTATTISSDTSPSTVGGQVTYTATVSPTPAGGTVAFTDGASAISGCDAAAVDQNGNATCRVTYSAAASHQITAAYSGDTDHQGSGSSPITQTVTAATTTTAVASSANPASAGDQVTYTATVAPVPDGGTVAFTDNGTTITGCDAAPVGGLGNASCQAAYPAVGSHEVTATYSGGGDFRGSASAALTQTVDQAATTTTLASSANPVAVGGRVTYTAGVSPDPSGGTIAFTDAGGTITGCDAVAVDGNGRASCPVTYSAPGSHPVTATYSGDADNRSSASPPLAQTVGKAATATTLASSADSAEVGREVTFTAAVSPAPGGGTVTFTDGGTTITGCGAVAVDGNGDATCPVTYSAVGGHAITATYSGDANSQGSAAIALGQTVSPAATATALESSLDPSAVGDAVTYTATVSPTPDGGTVAFTDNGAGITGCGSVTVDRSGDATCQATYSGVGSHPITATYSGDENFGGSASVTLVQGVDLFATGTALASSANPATVGQPVTFTATVAPTPAGGTIAFTDGGTTIAGCGAVAVDGNGQATCAATYPAVGSHPIVAVYSGDPSDQGSSSFTLTQDVAAAATVTTLSSSGDPSGVGDQVTYTATVSPTPTGGTVAFTDGASGITGCGAAPVGGLGNATCQTTYPAPGSHPITATYAGDANDQGSASKPLTQSVAKAAAAVVLESSGDPSAAGDQVTYTATVSPTPTGGTVAFTDAAVGIAGCDAVVVDPGGHAACQTTYPGAGSHRITATYSGDAAFQAAPSSTLTQTVDTAATAVALVSSGDPAEAGDQVSFTATVSPVPDGGTVAFTDNGTTIPGCDAAPLGGLGNATCQTTYPGAGSHAVTATYSGDADHRASTSSPLAQTVASATTMTALASSSNPTELGRQVTFTATVTPAPDGGSVAFADGGAALPGCGSVAVDGSGTAMCQVTYEAVGSHAITATYAGDGNFQGSASSGIGQAVGPAATTTMPASSGDPSSAGDRVTYTAIVSPTPAGGTIAFTDGATPITGCEAVAVDQNGEAACPVTYPAAGSHTIAATYSGDADDQASASASFTQTITTAATATSLSTSGDPSLAGQQVAYTAAVLPAPAGGAVAFSDDAAAITGCGAVAVDQNGNATCRVTYPTIGSHTIAAIYSGDADDQASSSRALGQTVGEAPTTTLLGASDNPSGAGRQVTYTATVSPAPDAGTVAFGDGGTAIGGCATVPVDSTGQATCLTTYPEVGSHAITATYSSDGSYLASASPPLEQTVARGSTTTGLASSLNPSAAGGQVTFTATVSPVPTGGTIAFTDGGDAIAGCDAVAVDGNGRATCMTTYPEAGSRTIAATYSGDAGSATSTSPPLAQTVVAPLAVTPVKIVSRPTREGFPAVSAAYLAWSQTSRRRPHHYNVFEQAMAANHPTGHITRVNPTGSFAYAGGISGTRLAYEQVIHGQSDIRFWNLARHQRSTPGPGVNTKAWETSPTITATWLLFGRITHRTSRVLLYNLKTHALRELSGVRRIGGHIARSGQVNGNYATYRTCTPACTVYLYNIATRHATRLPRPAGVSDTLSAVSAIGTVYFIRGGRACGAQDTLMQQPLGGARTELKAFSPEVGIAKIQTYPGADGRDQIFYSRTTCAGAAVHIFRATTP